MPCVTTEIGGEMELFPAHKWPSARATMMGTGFSDRQGRVNARGTMVTKMVTNTPTPPTPRQHHEDRKARHC